MLTRRDVLAGTAATVALASGLPAVANTLPTPNYIACGYPMAFHHVLKNIGDGQIGLNQVLAVVTTDHDNQRQRMLDAEPHAFVRQAFHYFREGPMPHEDDLVEAFKVLRTRLIVPPQDYPLLKKARAPWLRPLGGNLHQPLWFNADGSERLSFGSPLEPIEFALT